MLSLYQRIWESDMSDCHWIDIYRVSSVLSGLKGRKKRGKLLVCFIPSSSATLSECGTLPQWTQKVVFGSLLLESEKGWPQIQHSRCLPRCARLLSVLVGALRTCLDCFSDPSRRKTDIESHTCIFIWHWILDYLLHKLFNMS